MCARFSWPSGSLGKYGVPGFCFEWDKTALYCCSDDNYQNDETLLSSDSHINPVASYALMIPPHTPKAVRGPAVFFCLDDEDRLVKISRRAILALAAQNQLQGSDNQVTERVHFENMRRGAYLQGLQKQNFDFRAPVRESKIGTSSCLLLRYLY